MHGYFLLRTVLPSLSLSSSAPAEVALAVLDRCFTDNATEENPDIVNSKNYEVTLDFEFLEDWRPKVSRGFKGRLSRLTRRGIVYDESYSSTANLYTNSSNAVSSVDISSHATSENEEENQSTRWKVEGFSKNRHPLSLMVSDSDAVGLCVCHSYWLKSSSF